MLANLNVYTSLWARNLCFANLNVYTYFLFYLISFFVLVQIYANIPFNYITFWFLNMFIVTFYFLIHL
jgi:hypothetical protein